MRLTTKFGIIGTGFSTVVLCAVLAGCGDDGTQPDTMSLADFEGSWAAQSYKLTDATVPAISLEVVSLGATFEWDVDDSGHFSGSAFLPAALVGMDVDLDFQGTFTLIGQDSLIINFAPEIPPFLTQTRAEFTLVGNVLTLIDDEETFDIDQDGNDEAVIFEGRLVRN